MEQAEIERNKNKAQEIKIPSKGTHSFLRVYSGQQHKQGSWENRQWPDWLFLWGFL